MNILLLDFGRELRGGQRQVLYLAAALQKSGKFNPIIVSPKGAPLIELAEKYGIETVAIGFGIIGRTFGFLKLRRLMASKSRQSGTAEEAKAWVIHTNDARSAAFGARLLGKRQERTENSEHFAKDKIFLLHTRRVSYPIKKGLRGAKYLKAHAVACVSREIADVMAAGGVPEKRLSVIHSGINPSLYPRHQERGDGRLIFVALGALTAQKGHEVLLKALPRLAGSGVPVWELRIIGQGPLFDELFGLAKNLHVEHSVSFLGQQDSRRQLQYCDIMIVPSVSGEGSSATIKEAWATGLPLLCSNLSSNLELLDPEVNGLSFHSGDSEDLANQLIRLSINKTLQEKLVAGGDKTLPEFTHTRMAEKYMELYRELYRTAGAFTTPQASSDLNTKTPEQVVQWAIDSIATEQSA